MTINYLIAAICFMVAICIVVVIDNEIRLRKLERKAGLRPSAPGDSRNAGSLKDKK